MRREHAVNNNSGSFYNFVGAPLLRCCWWTIMTPRPKNEGSTVIPDSAYTNALAAAGVSYGSGRCLIAAIRSLPICSRFPVVIWRMTDDM